jgi:hypothetical protein
MECHYSLKVADILQTSTDNQWSKDGNDPFSVVCIYSRRKMATSTKFQHVLFNEQLLDPDLENNFQSSVFVCAFLCVHTTNCSIFNYLQRSNYQNCQIMYLKDASCISHDEVQVGAGYRMFQRKVSHSCFARQPIHCRVYNGISMTHSRLLSTIMECTPIAIILKRRYINFINRVLQHNNHLINLWEEVCIQFQIT